MCHNYAIEIIIWNTDSAHKKHLLYNICVMCICNKEICYYSLNSIIMSIFLQLCCRTVWLFLITFVVLLYYYCDFSVKFLLRYIIEISVAFFSFLLHYIERKKRLKICIVIGIIVYFYIVIGLSQIESF